MDKVDINGLSVQQLAQVREQLDKELEHLSDSFTQLRRAQSQFQSCRLSVRDASAEGTEGRELLVPMSATLYVPGKMKNTDRYLVDVGTDYYVEKSAAEAVQFFTTKIETLNGNLADLDKLVSEKVAGLQAVDVVFKRKLGEAQRANAAGAGAAGSGTAPAGTAPAS